MDSIAIGTWVIALATWAGVGGTLYLVRRQSQIAKEQAKIQPYLQLRKEFDGELVSARKLLAQQLMDGVAHEDINEPVMNFFEDMGMFSRRDYLYHEMVWDTFSYYARYWWSATRDYIAKERADRKDETLFGDFDQLAEQIAEYEAKQKSTTRVQLEPSAADVRTFLDAEAKL